MRKKMTRKILINAQDPDVSRIAAVIDNKLDQFHIETRAKEVTQGNIYKGSKKARNLLCRW